MNKLKDLFLSSSVNKYRNLLNKFARDEISEKNH